MQRPAKAQTATQPRVPREIMNPPDERGLYINEIFASIQGEGRHMGLPTVFLRTMGCHLRCVWCDTQYSFYEGAWKPWNDVLSALDATGLRRLCLTGGEPLLQRDAWPLVRHLLAESWQVSIETSGSIECHEATLIEKRLGTEARARLCLSVDVKCPGSGEGRTWNSKNLDHLRPQDQLKFIVADRADYEFARDWIKRHPDVPCPLWIHPVGGLGGKLLGDLADWARADRLDAHIGIQLHKLLWGDARGV